MSRITSQKHPARTRAETTTTQHADWRDAQKPQKQSARTKAVTKAQRAHDLMILTNILLQETRTGKGQPSNRYIRRVVRRDYGLDWGRGKIQGLMKKATLNKNLTYFAPDGTIKTSFVRETKLKKITLGDGTEAWRRERTITRWSHLSKDDGALLLAELVYSTTGSITPKDVERLLGLCGADSRQIHRWVNVAVAKGWMVEEGLVWSTTNTIPHVRGQQLLKQAQAPAPKAKVEDFLPVDDADAILLKHLQQEQIISTATTALSAQLKVPIRSLERSLKALSQQGKLFNTPFVSGHKAGRGRFLSLKPLGEERTLELTMRVVKGLPLTNTFVTEVEQVEPDHKLRLRATFKEIIEEQLGGSPLAGEVALKHSSSARSWRALQKALAVTPLALDESGRALNIPDVAETMYRLHCLPEQNLQSTRSQPVYDPEAHHWMDDMIMKLDL